MPVMATRALWEGRVFSDPNTRTNKSFHADLQALIPNGTPDFFHRLTKLYPGDDYHKRRYELFGDYFVNCPTAWLLAAVNKKKMPAYKLIFKEGDQNHGAEAGYLYWTSRTYRFPAIDGDLKKRSILGTAFLSTRYEGLVLLLRHIFRSE
jgi:carboxylesterase type B